MQSVELQFANQKYHNRSIWNVLESLGNTSDQSAETVPPGGLGLIGHGAAQFLLEDGLDDSSQFLWFLNLHFNSKSKSETNFLLEINLKHGDGNSAGLVSATEGINLSGQEFGAGQGLDDDVQTGQDGVGLSQEVAVGHQLGLGNISELAELALVLGVGLDESIIFKNLMIEFVYEH